MSTLGGMYTTLLDYAKRVAPSGGIDDIVEVLAASNPILNDCHIKEGNLPTGHLYTERATQPTGSWRLLNYGVLPEKSTTNQFTDVCAILEAYSQIDVDIASLGGNEAAYRASEDNAFVAGMSSTMATAMFYGNQGVNPEQPMGFAPRFNSLSGKYGGQVVNGGGSGGDNTSIWMITWGEKMASVIFPKGSVAGLVSEDVGRQLVTDSNNRKFMAWVTRFQWKLGINVEDYRHVVRIANIDVSDLTSDASSGADLIDKLIDAYYSRPSASIGDSMARTYIYCNATIAKFMHKQALVPANVALTIDTVAGKPIVNVLGAPVHVCDNIINAEEAVS